jgi:hypothetical protein
MNVWLTPRISVDSPEIEIVFNGDQIYQGVLTSTTCFGIDQLLPAGTQEFVIKFTNKTDSDTTETADKAVVIDRVQFNGIDSDRFAWAGIYEPTYPEPWYSQQNPLPELLLKSHTYLGWNGKWTLTFTTPIFTWIHGVEDLGWIYG